MVDVGGYRLRRESFLSKKAEAVARIVLETRREMSLDLLTEKEMEIIVEHLRGHPRGPGLFGSGRRQTERHHRPEGMSAQNKGATRSPNC